MSLFVVVFLLSSLFSLFLRDCCSCVPCKLSASSGCFSELLSCSYLLVSVAVVFVVLVGGAGVVIGVVLLLLLYPSSFLSLLLFVATNIAELQQHVDYGIWTSCS